MNWAKLLRIVERTQVVAGYNGSCESAVGYDLFVAGLRDAAAHDDPAMRAKLLQAHRLLRQERAQSDSHGVHYYLVADNEGWRAYVGGKWLGGQGRHADPVEAAKLAIEDRHREVQY
jgi:hypothetical protein